MAMAQAPQDVAAFAKYFRARRDALHYSQDEVARDFVTLFGEGDPTKSVSRHMISDYETSMNDGRRSFWDPFFRKWLELAEQGQLPKRTPQLVLPGRQSRTEFTTSQTRHLSRQFRANDTPDSNVIGRMGLYLDLDKPVVYNWFGNRRRDGA